MTYRTEASLKEGTPYNLIFPEKSIPVISILPTLIGKQECYIVNSKQLMPEQIQALAKLLLNNGQGVPSIEAAIAYIHEGLPIKIDWFNTVSTNDPGIFFSMMDGPEEDCQNSQPDDYDDDWDDDDDCWGSNEEDDYEA
jgi:hypothetical protein